MNFTRFDHFWRWALDWSQGFFQNCSQFGFGQIIPSSSIWLGFPGTTECCEYKFCGFRLGIYIETRSRDLFVKIQLIFYSSNSRILKCHYIENMVSYLFTSGFLLHDIFGFAAKVMLLFLKGKKSWDMGILNVLAVFFLFIYLSWWN